MSREERIQEILNYIRFNVYGIEEELKKNDDLFEQDDLKHEFEEDKANWDEDYIAKNLVWLRKNFSRKRLEHLIEVRNYVRGEIVKPKSVEVKIEKRSTKKLDNIRKQNNSDGKLFQWVVNKFNNLIGKDKKKVRDRIRSRRKDD